MTTKEMIAVLEAYDRGETIQVHCLDGSWGICNMPGWDFFNHEYRVKPKPREFWIRPASRVFYGMGDSIVEGPLPSAPGQPVPGYIHVREVLE